MRKHSEKSDQEHLFTLMAHHFIFLLPSWTLCKYNMQMTNGIFLKLNRVCYLFLYVLWCVFVKCEKIFKKIRQSTYFWLLVLFLTKIFERNAKVFLMYKLIHCQKNGNNIKKRNVFCEKIQHQLIKCFA